MPTSINLGKIRPVDKGEWSSTYEGGYDILDIVTSGKGSYMSKVKLNTFELTDRTKWIPLVDSAAIELAIQEANEAAAAADAARLAIEGELALKADQTELDQLAGELPLYLKKEAISKIPAGKNIFDPLMELIPGYIDVSTGQYVTAPGNYYSSPIPTGPALLSISGLGNIHHGLGWRFNKADGSIALRGYAAINATEFSADASALTDVVSFQFTVKTTKDGDNTDVNTIQVEVGTKTDFEPFVEMVDKIDGMEIIAGKTKEDYVNLNSLDFSPGKNLLNPSEVKKGYIDPSNGNIVIADPYRYVTIPIGAEYLTISGLGGINYGLGWRFNKADGSIALRGSSTSNVTEFFADARGLTDVVSFECTLVTGKVGDITDVNNVQIEIGTKTDFEPYKQLISEIEGYRIKSLNDYSPKTAGKKIMFLGESITTEAATTGTPIDNWPKYARYAMGITDYKNYALSGASFVDWAYTDGIRQQLSAQIDQAVTDEYIPDIVVISIGTNDYTRFSVLGDYDTAIGKALIADLDRTIVIEAARYAFWKLRELYPNAKMFYANPLQRVSTPNSSEADDNGKWLREPIERMARRYGFVVIDQYGESGIVKEFEVNGANGRYLIDGLHTNSAGKRLQGAFIANKIMAEYFV